VIIIAPLPGSDSIESPYLLYARILANTEDPQTKSNGLSLNVDTSTRQE